MKKLTLTLAIAFSIGSYGQITLEHTYLATGQPQIINLAISGYKYAFSTGSTTSNDTLKLYDLSHALWKTIVVPVPTGHYLGFYPSYLSETLFNSDNLIEFVYGTYVYPPMSSNTNMTVYVMNESGTVLFNQYIGNSQTGGSAVVGNVGANLFKLFVTDSASNCYVYSLPGTLPCDACGGYGTAIQQYSNGERMSGITSQPIPNPSNGNTTIKYNLPNGTNKGELIVYDTQGRQIKSYIVDRTFDSLILSNTNLPSGTYFYQLKTDNGYSDTKKMLIIK